MAERLQPLSVPDPLPEDAGPVAAMAERLCTPEGKALYAKRKSTVEAVFGIVKEAIGFRRSPLRGFEATQGEWNLMYRGVETNARLNGVMGRTGRVRTAKIHPFGRCSCSHRSQ